MNKKVVKGDILIVPNKIGKLKNLITSSGRETAKERLARLAGLIVEDEDEVIQAWITSPETDNWCCEYGGFQKKILGQPEEKWLGIDRTKEEILLGYFPELFPKKLFQGKKEGDTVKLHCPEYNVDIEITLNQLGYRYARFGKFEEVLDQV